MDKYEYNLKLEEIDKLVDQGDYEEAANLADTVEWKRVRNVRTLCLISEIYEAAGRLADSKKILERAYRKSPVGKNVLYRLVEVTTALQQYDEALEYYTEYVQAAPHDNNRYILKYKLYRGRGSSVEELISILEEYLGQEYTERWAYELAKLYRQAGQMQKCLAACDDLVLWFHSGKYVLRALELKKKYAALTPKQEQIYAECLQEKEEELLGAPDQEPEELPDEKEKVVVKMESTEGEVMAEKIIAETEREIAEEVTARKAEMESKAPAEPVQEELQATRRMDAPQSVADSVRQGVASILAAQSEAAAQLEKLAGEEIPGTEKLTEEEPETSAEETSEAQAEEPDRPVAEPFDQEALQMELAKSMREIVSGVIRHPEVAEEDLPASVTAGPQSIPKAEPPKSVREQTVNRLSIDDVLLSMGDRGKEIAAKAAQAEQEKAARMEQAVQLQAEEETNAAAAVLDAKAEEMHARTITEMAEDDLTEAQREALQYTSHPEKLLRNRNALPTYTEEELGETRRAVSREELVEAARQGLISEKTIEHAAACEMAGAQTCENTEYEAEETLEYGEEQYETEENPEYGEEQYEAEENPEYGEEQYEAEENPEYEDEQYESEYGSEDGQEYSEPEYEEAPEYGDTEGREYGEAADEEGYYEEYEDGDYLMIPEHLRGLFSGFTEIPDLEDQIANAIIQAESKGGDRTSKSGNILIFGAHGSGKTTLAMNLAKAIAQDRGSQVMKMAKIYAADLNKKDIAATIAKIAGGTLIVEEAGDLDDNTVDELTTAMEFRTDGLIVILEDEQQYVHELLMRHPRFTMKFTAQIYIPDYTIEELAGFGQIHANLQDYMIGDEGMEALYERISALAETSENGVTISDVIELVSKAIEKSNGFLRKMQMGKRRYDENDYIILFAKDFK